MSDNNNEINVNRQMPAEEISTGVKSQGEGHGGESYGGETPGKEAHIVTSTGRTKREKKKISFAAALAMCLSFAIIAASLNMASLYYIFNYKIPENYIKKSDIKIGSVLSDADRIENTGNSLEKTDSSEYSVKQIAKLALPSVVAITSKSYITQGWNPFSQGSTYQVKGAGSGIIIGQNEKEVCIVTNNHVVEGAKELTVEFADGKTYTAYVKGKTSDVDIAVVYVKVEEISAETLAAIKIAAIGNSGDIEVGDEVVAIGNALGYGQSVTNGIVSALNREITTESYKMKMIQTNAAINGGNSGGALINMRGEVIGINSAKSSSSGSMSSASIEGMGYAIPISDVMDVINDIISNNVSEKGYLGLTVIDVSQEDADKYSLKVGINVNKVAEKSGANEAGIYPGDVITKVNGEEVSTADDMNLILMRHKAGEKVTLTILTNVGKGKYEEKTVEVELKTYDSIYS